MADEQRVAALMVKEPEADRRLQAFGDALARAMAVRGMTQRALGEKVGGLSQASVGGWIAGESEPSPARVFLIEEILELPPGHLSKLLGYVPPPALDGSIISVDEAVAADSLLDETQKRMILALYREATARKPGGRGRPPKKPKS